MPAAICHCHRAALLGGAAAVLALQACLGAGQASQPPTGGSGTAEARAIRAARAAQNRAMASGDVERVAGFWTEDVEIRRGLGQLVVGRAAYRELVAAGVRDSGLVYEREPDTVEVSPHWPLAYESGTWAGHLGRADGPVVIRGRYSAQWLKRAGAWLIRGEVFVALTCAGVGCTYPAAP